MTDLKNQLSDKSIHSKYLIANDHDLLWGLTVNTIGKQVIGKNETYPSRNHPSSYLFSTENGRILNEYQLLYIAKGTGTFVSDSQKQIEIKEGNMFLLFPNEWHSYKPNPLTGWEEYWIGFNGVNMDKRIYNGFFNKQKPVFNVGISEEIIQLYKQGILIATEQKAGFQQLLAGITNHLLGITYSLDKHWSFEDINVANTINKAKILFAENFRVGVEPEWVAGQLNMSYSWFRRLFKEYTGFPPAQYIRELRIRHSMELLTNSGLNVKEIAYDCGFDNPEYFCTAFKNRLGLTPVKYRNFTQGKIIRDSQITA